MLVSYLAPHDLPSSQSINDIHKAAVCDWSSFCTRRCLSLGSTLPILLSFPLTVCSFVFLFKVQFITNQTQVYHILMNKMHISTDKPLVVHYLGPEKEIGQLPLWRELAFLFNNIELSMLALATLYSLLTLFMFRDRYDWSGCSLIVTQKSLHV